MTCEAEILTGISARNVKIAKALYSRKLDGELRALCDGRTDFGHWIEYWGDDIQGNPWRVHLMLQEFRIRCVACTESTLVCVEARRTANNTVERIPVVPDGWVLLTSRQGYCGKCSRRLFDSEGKSS